MREQIRTAVRGALVGATLGATLPAARSFRRIPFFDPIPHRMSPSETLDWWFAASEWLTWDQVEPLNDYRAKRCAYHSGALGFAAANHVKGWGTPASGILANPLTETSSAIGRAIFWGLIAASESQTQAAFDDLSFSHSDEGLQCGIATVVLISQVLAGKPVLAATEGIAGLLGKRAMAGVSAVLSANLQAVQPQELYELIRIRSEASDAHDGPLHFSLAIAALLSTSDFESAMTMIGGLGGNSDACMLVGAVAASRSSTQLLDWMKPLGASYVSGFGLSGLDAPATLEAFIDSIARLIVEPQPFTVAPDTEPEPISHPDTDQIRKTLERLLAESGPHTKISSKGPIQITYELLSSGKESRFEAALTYFNPTAETVPIQTSHTSDWGISMRHLETQIPPGGTVKKPVILQVADPVRTRFELVVNGESLPVPLLPVARIYTLGPLQNTTDNALDYDYPCEKEINLKASFASRSGIGIKWSERILPPYLFDFEPDFNGGPGVMYVVAKLNLPAGKNYKLVFSGSPGGIVKINQQVKIRYQDTHRPTYQAEDPYVCNFVSSGDDEVLVRVIRRNQATAPFALYLLDDVGSVLPVHSEPLF